MDAGLKGLEAVLTIARRGSFRAAALDLAGYSIANALRGTAYHLVVMPFFPDQDPMEPIRYIVETESADGIILNQTKEDDPRIRYMHDHGFPFAAHGRSNMGIDHLYFDFDTDSFGRLGARG